MRKRRQFGVPPIRRRRPVREKEEAAMLGAGPRARAAADAAAPGVGNGLFVNGLVTEWMVRILSVVDAYTRVPGTESGQEPGLWPGDAGARARDHRAWPARERALGQRPGVYARRMLGWAGTWKVGWCTSNPAVRCRTGCRELLRQAGRQMPGHELVAVIQYNRQSPSSTGTPFAMSLEARYISMTIA